MQKCDGNLCTRQISTQEINSLLYPSPKRLLWQPTLSSLGLPLAGPWCSTGSASPGSAETAALRLSAQAVQPVASSTLPEGSEGYWLQLPPQRLGKHLACDDTN